MNVCGVTRRGVRCVDVTLFAHRHGAPLELHDHVCARLPHHPSEPHVCMCHHLWNTSLPARAQRGTT